MIKISRSLLEKILVYVIVAGVMNKSLRNEQQEAIIKEIEELLK